MMLQCEIPEPSGTLDCIIISCDCIFWFRALLYLEATRPSKLVLSQCVLSCVTEFIIELVQFERPALHWGACPGR